MENFKALVVCVFTGLMAYLNPISGDLISMLVIFLLNFCFGLLAAIIVNDEEFKFKKAFRCVSEATIFFLLVCAIFFIGKQKGNIDGALQCVSFVSYSVFYFYGVNMLRNLKLLFPNSRAIAFLYDILSIEFAKKIPGLNNYLGKEVSDESK